MSAPALAAEATPTSPTPSGAPRPKTARLRPQGWIALVVLALFVLGAILGPVVRPFDSVDTRLGARLLPPGATLSDGSVAPLGTDPVGHDLLAEVLAGSRVSLVVGLATVLLGGFIGLALGLVSGYFGRAVDSVISRIVDIQLAFPSILLAILLAGVLGPGLLNIILALALTRWVIFARVVRASAISVRNLDYVDSARVLGAGHTRIILQHVMPSCWQALLVAATTQVGLTMVAEASLSYLGLGVPVSQASWGSTISEGGDYLGSAWWIATIPGLALAIVVVCVAVLGDELHRTTVVQQ